jgi:hypothetical protein
MPACFSHRSMCMFGTQCRTVLRVGRWAIRSRPMSGTVRALFGGRSCAESVNPVTAGAGGQSPPPFRRVTIAQSECRCHRRTSAPPVRRPAQGLGRHAAVPDVAGHDAALPDPRPFGMIREQSPVRSPRRSRAGRALIEPCHGRGGHIGHHSAPVRRRVPATNFQTRACQSSIPAIGL